MSRDISTPAKHSCLLAMPGELRNRIYTYVVASHEPILLYSYWAGGNDQPALAATCAQVRRETLSLCYSLNTFHLHIYPNLDVNVFTRWIDAIGPLNAQALKTVNVTFHFGVDVTLLIQRVEPDSSDGSGTGRKGSWVDLDMGDAEDRLPMHGFWIIRERLRSALGMPQFGDVEGPTYCGNLVEAVNNVYLIGRKPWYQLDEL